MAIDVERARRETLGVRTVTHLNNAGSSLPPDCVTEAQIAHLQLEARYGGYEARERAATAVSRTYDAIAALIGATRDEIAVVENATRAWDMAFYAVPFKPGDRILTAMAEYSSNFVAYLQLARTKGVQIDVVPSDADGQLDVAALERMMDERVRLISVTHVPTNGGLVNPAAEIGAVARRHGALFLLDACQSIGQIPIDVDTLGCDMLSATARKYLRGPRGMGFLYVRKAVIPQLEPVILDMHAAEWVAPDRYELAPDARRFENWESNYAAKIGMGVAVDYALAWGLPAIAARVQLLAGALRARLADVPGCVVRDLGRVRCGIVTFTLADHDPEAIKQALANVGINVSVTTTAWTRLDMSARGLTGMVRASVHYFNTEDELDQLCAALKSLTRA
jgi:cysteine desulfurase / selenocysteine lyase